MRREKAPAARMGARATSSTAFSPPSQESKNVTSREPARRNGTSETAK
jgi:hypothetical protein